METPPPEQIDPKDEERRERLRGMRLGAKLHLLQIPIGVAWEISFSQQAGDWRQFPMGFLMAISTIGFTQVVYMLPARLILLAKGRKAQAKGISQCALITFVLNVAIGGLFIFYLCSQFNR